MNKTKIDYVEYSWNPVWGCKNNCPYCYARATAQRFGESFEPHWKEKNFNRSMPRAPSTIFVNSMSDIAFWENDWVDRVFWRIWENPQHTFYLLTKDPECYSRLDLLAPENCWFGVTITTQEMMEDLANLIAETTWHEKRNLFLSIEPILEEIYFCVLPDWVIVGAESGNRKEKVIPRLAWIEKLAIESRGNNIPIWLKENLREIWPRKLIQEKPEL